ncbi:MAG: trans-aconitate 2-methyltransferase [Methanobacterium sp. PtaU1.Bin242]|nr:MAG: trans-aconitate 2-methyltransferase [Methanobacterium sp. PtaU1.Bin242]
MSARIKSIDMWETSYYHIMQSHQSIVEMLKSTGMRKFLDLLDTKEEKIEFEKDVLKEITKAYPVQKDGNVLFPFKRLFFIGYK